MFIEARREIVQQPAGKEIQSLPITAITLTNITRKGDGLSPGIRRLLKACTPDNSQIPVEISFIDGIITRARWDPEEIRQNTLRTGGVPMKSGNLLNDYHTALFNCRDRGSFDRIRISAVLDEETTQIVMNLSEAHNRRQEQEANRKPLEKTLFGAGADLLATATLINCVWRTVSLTEESAASSAYGFSILAAIAGGAYLAHRLNFGERIGNLLNRFGI